MNTQLKLVSLLILVIAFSIKINAQDNTTELPFKRTFKMEGRIMYDFTFLSAGDYTFAGNKFRRLRLTAKGKISKNVSYVSDFDFTGGKIAYRNVNLRLTLPVKAGELLIGSFEVPTGLDMLISSKYLPFIERAFVTNTQYGKHNAGFEYMNDHILDGKVNLQLATTFNGVGSKAHQDTNLEGGVNFIGRLVGKAYENKEKRHIIHLGVNYENRKNEVEDFSYKAVKIENNMGDGISISSTGNLKNTSDIGFELASTFGSFSFQGEYEAGSIVTDVNTYKSTTYYGLVSYFITGEHRPYKNGVFTRVKPKSTFLQNGGLGAIEILARYSVMDLNGNMDVDNLDDKNYVVQNLTLGLNWHWNAYTRVMYNFTNGDLNDLAPVSYNEEKLMGHLVRFQVDF